MVKSSIVAFVLLLISHRAFSQQYQITHYTKDKGLPGNQVWSVYQDSKGYMWFATSDALVKYNGKDYRLYNKTAGLLEDFALSLGEDRKGNLWAGCPGGVSRVAQNKIDTWKFGKFDDFYGVFVDSYDKVWAYNFQFVSDVQVIDHDSVYNFSHMYGLKNQRVYYVNEDRNGAVYLLVQGNKMFRFFTNTIAEVPIDKFLRDVEPRMFFFDSKGALILSGRKGTAKLVFKDGDRNPEMTWLLEESSMFALESNSGYYWIATRDDGLFRLKPDHRDGHGQTDVLHLTDQNGLSTNSLFTLFEDREQNLWIGTNLRGICKLPSIRFIGYGKNEGFKAEAILAIAPRHGTLYCSTEKGVYKFTGANFVKMKILGKNEPALSDRFYLCLMPTTHEAWLFGSAPGLYFMDAQGNVELVGLSRLVVQTFLKDSRGDIWVGTNRGTYKLQGEKNPVQQDFGIKNRFVNKILEVGNKDIYVATDSGLVIIESATLPLAAKTIRVLTTKDGLFSDMINDIAVLPDGEILVATGNGINVIAEKETYGIVEGLNDRFVIVLFVDRRGGIWAGTDNGLHLLHKARGKYRVVAGYFQKDGLMSNEFTRNGTMFEDEQDRLWIGTYGGLTVYDPREEPLAMVKPPCYLTSMSVNDSAEAIEAGGEFTFDYTQNKMRFFYEGLSFFDEDAVKFEYYLEPLEKPWSSFTKMSNVSYGYLKSGSYAFHVRAISPFGIAGDPQRVSFTILPPFWERPWFLALIGGILLIIGYRVNHYRLTRARERNLLLETLVSEKTTELQESKNVIEEHYHRLLAAQEELVEKEKLEKAYQEIQILRNRLATENIYLREKQTKVQEVGSIIGRSDAMQQIRQKIVEVASTDSTVLITGETGTGKNLVAEAIHTLSPRKERALVAVNCAAIPEGLVESELFGHEKGAFTGANERRLGKFEIADGSTIFLDEIGDMNLAIQAKILNVLQERKITRVGANQPIKTDVRIIGSTNYDLEELVKAGGFRNDLYYRMNVYRMHIPPLRERREDIELLAKFFADRFSKSLNKEIKAITKGALDSLELYAFPGNVREMENIIQRAVIICKSDVITAEDIVLQSGGGRGVVGRKFIKNGAYVSLDQVEREYILQVLEKTHWKIRGEGGAAQILGLHPNTLRSRMEKLEIPFSRRQH